MDARIQQLVEQGHPERSARMIADAERSAQAALRLAERTVLDATMVLISAGEWCDDSPGGLRHLQECQERCHDLSLSLAIAQADQRDHRQARDRAGARETEVVHQGLGDPDSNRLPAHTAPGSAYANRLGHDVDFTSDWAVARSVPAMRPLCDSIVMFYIRLGLLAASPNKVVRA
jgi:hypothetical protein